MFFYTPTVEQIKAEQARLERLVAIKEKMLTKIDETVYYEVAIPAGWNDFIQYVENEQKLTLK